MKNEQGSISLFLVVLAVAILGLGGVVNDAGSALVATRRATDSAENAARAGIQAGSAPGQTQAVTLDPHRAQAAADAFLAAENLDGDVTVGADQVQVTVRLRQPTTLLRAVGITHLDVSGTGTARALAGVTEAQR